MSGFAVWLASAIATLVPAEPSERETAEAREERYAEIARDAEAASLDRPLAGMTAAETATLLTAIAYYESAFGHDVDSGRCNRVRTKRCDRGRSVGLIQLHFPRGSRTFLGRTREELIGHRREVFAAGLEFLERGMKVCRRTRHRATLEATLAWYARGKCSSAGGRVDALKKLALYDAMRAGRGDFTAYAGPAPQKTEPAIL